MPDEGWGQSTGYSGPAILATDDGEYAVSVQLRLELRANATRRVRGRVVGASRDEVLEFGFLVECRVPRLFDGGIRCVLHLNGALESL